MRGRQWVPDRENGYADCIVVSCYHMMNKIIDFDQATGKIYSFVHDYFTCIMCRILGSSSTDSGAEFPDVTIISCHVTISEEL